MPANNRLVLIGNGFDLAHGLKTTYKDFLDWYMCQSFKQFCSGSTYQDELIELKYKYAGTTPLYEDAKNLEDVLSSMSRDNRQSLTFKTIFFQELIEVFNTGSWVNIECQYFQKLKSIFHSKVMAKNERRQAAFQLNLEFDVMIGKLSQYFVHVNTQIYNHKRLPINTPRLNINKAFQDDKSRPVTFLNFNYTDTLNALGYAEREEIIHIHGNVANIENNPIIFGYGDESDSAYQMIEDSGDNVYLDHIKSFGYFKTNNYSRLISLIESDSYEVYIVGHSCGLSDRILLNEIFENQNCRRIEIFYHQRKDNTDNFKEITQEISRHFKPHNKGMMRRRVGNQDPKNIIPQN